jgi:hypothetical protein
MEPRHYPEYAQDYYAIFLEDPDGLRLEIMNFREMRREHLFDREHEPGAGRSTINRALIRMVYTLFEP